MELDLDSFTVTLKSDCSLDFYPNNTSTFFTNVLYKPICLPEGMFKVGVSEIFFQEASPDSNKPETYFGIPTSGNEMKIYDKVGLLVQFEKSTEDIESYFSGLTSTFDFISIGSLSTTFSISLVHDLESGFKKTKLTFQDSERRYSLKIYPLKYLEAFGFTQMIFESGEYISPFPFSQEKFEAIPFNDLIYIQCTDEVPKVVKIPEPSIKSIPALITKIIIEFSRLQYRVRMPIGENDILKVFIDERNLSFQLPVVINKLFSLPDNFIFIEKETTISLGQRFDYPQKHIPTRHIMIHSPVITEQFYGNTCIPLLRIFPKKEDAIQSTSFNQIYYYDLRYSKISEIQILLTGENLIQLPASVVPSTVILQFKRKL